MLNKKAGHFKNISPAYAFMHKVAEHYIVNLSLEDGGKLFILEQRQIAMNPDENHLLSLCGLLPASLPSVRRASAARPYPPQAFRRPPNLSRFAVLLS